MSFIVADTSMKQSRCKNSSEPNAVCVPNQAFTVSLMQTNELMLETVKSLTQNTKINKYFKESFVAEELAETKKMIPKYFAYPVFPEILMKINYRYHSPGLKNIFFILIKLLLSLYSHARQEHAYETMLQVIIIESLICPSFCN